MPFRVVSSQPNRLRENGYRVKLEELNPDNSPTGNFFHSEMKRRNGKLESIDGSKPQPERSVSGAAGANFVQNAAGSLAALGPIIKRNPWIMGALLAKDGVEYGARHFFPEETDAFGRGIADSIAAVTGMDSDEIAEGYKKYGYSWNRFNEAKAKTDELLPVGYTGHFSDTEATGIGAAGALGAIGGPGLAGGVGSSLAKKAFSKEPTSLITEAVKNIGATARPVGGVTTGAFAADSVGEALGLTTPEENNKRTQAEKIHDAELGGSLGSMAVPASIMAGKGLYGLATKSKGERSLEGRAAAAVKEMMTSPKANHLEFDPELQAAARRTSIPLTAAEAASKQGRESLSGFVQTNRAEVERALGTFENTQKTIANKMDDAIGKTDATVPPVRTKEPAFDDVAADIASARKTVKDPFDVEYDGLKKDFGGVKANLNDAGKKNFSAQLDELGQQDVPFGKLLDRIKNGLNAAKEKNKITIGELINVRKTALSIARRGEDEQTRGAAQRFSKIIDDLIEDVNPQASARLKDISARYRTEYSDVFQNRGAVRMRRAESELRREHGGGDAGLIGKNFVSSSGTVSTTGSQNLTAIKGMYEKAGKPASAMTKVYDKVGAAIATTARGNPARLIKTLDSDENFQVFTQHPELLNSVMRANNTRIANALNARGKGLGQEVDDMANMLEWAGKSPQNMETLKKAANAAFGSKGVDLLRWQTGRQLQNTEKPFDFFEKNQQSLSKLWEPQQLQVLRDLSLLKQNAALFSRAGLFGGSRAGAKKPGAAGKITEWLESKGQPLGAIISSLRGVLRNIQSPEYLAVSHNLSYMRSMNNTAIIRAMLDETTAPSTGVKFAINLAKGNLDKLDKGTRDRIIRRSITYGMNANANEADSAMHRRRSLEIGKPKAAPNHFGSPDDFLSRIKPN